MDTIKEIESIRTDILDTIAKCECGDDCESVVYLKKIAGRLSSVSSCCRPLAEAPAASPTPDGAAPSAPVTSVPSVSSVPSNTAKLREALLKANGVLIEAAHHNLTEEYINECLALIHAALAAPPRNCDVGAVEEQEKRMDAFCVGRRCAECPIPHKNLNDTYCVLAWSQAPYEEGGAK